MTIFNKNTDKESSKDDPVSKMNEKMIDVLPNALIKALSTYEEFLEKTDPKQKLSCDYQEHQMACKAALAHIDLLIKLADRLKVLSGPDEQDRIDQLEDFVADALSEIENRKNRKSEGETP